MTAALALLAVAGLCAAAVEHWVRLHERTRANDLARTLEEVRIERLLLSVRFTHTREDAKTASARFYELATTTAIREARGCILPDLREELPASAGPAPIFEAIERGAAA